jgi:hypothetical protein
VREGRLHPHHRAGDPLPPDLRRGPDHDLHVQHRRREAHLLQGLRREELLPARSNPDGWSVNARCLDTTEGLDLRIEAFDGQNWEAHAAALAHLSKED